MNEPLFTKPLHIPTAGEKLYVLSAGERDELLRQRGERTELDPGMGGVSPAVLTEMLKTSSRLVSVDLALTSKCNFNCIHCYRPEHEQDSVQLDRELLSETIPQCISLGVRYFILTGGEPLMYNGRDGKGSRFGFFDVVDMIRQAGGAAGQEVEILAFSDVALIDGRCASMLAERDVSLCLKRDTLDHGVQDAIVGGPGRSQAMAAGYRRLFEAGYGREPAPAATVNQVLRKGDADTLRGTVDLHLWVRENGMEHSIIPIHYCGNAGDEHQPGGINPLEVKALYDILAAIDGMLFDDPWTVYSAFTKNKTCNRPGRGVHIRATGAVTSCSESPLIEPYHFGNIREQDLATIIASEKFQSFSRRFTATAGTWICNPAVCDLNAGQLCRGGCATRSAYSRLDPDTGLIKENVNHLSYSDRREDPLCPGWAVLAQRQGVLRDGLYRRTAASLLAGSHLDPAVSKTVLDQLTSDFDSLLPGVEHSAGSRGQK